MNVSAKTLLCELRKHADLERRLASQLDFSRNLLLSLKINSLGTGPVQKEPVVRCLRFECVLVGCVTRFVTQTDWNNNKAISDSPNRQSLSKSANGHVRGPKTE